MRPSPKRVNTVPRMVTVEGKVALWPRFVAAYRRYADHERQSRRDIPLHAWSLDDPSGP